MPCVLQAFVDFDSGAEAERAITTKDRQVFAQKFGDRYVRLVQALHYSNVKLMHQESSSLSLILADTCLWGQCIL